MKKLELSHPEVSIILTSLAEIVEKLEEFQNLDVSDAEKTEAKETAMSARRAFNKIAVASDSRLTIDEVNK